MQEWTVAAARMTKGLPAGTDNDDPLAPARRHRRGDRPRPRRPDDHRRLRAVALRRPLRAGRRQRPAGAEADPAAARRRARPDDQQRRPLHPGVRERPAGRLPRGPQHDEDRPGRRGDALVPARVRADVADRRRAGDAPQPDGLQGRDQQHPQRRRRRARAVRLGRRRGAGVDARRQLPGQPPDPDADRALGPDVPAGAGGRDRPDEGERRADRREEREGRRRPRRDRPRRQPRDPRRRPHPPLQPRERTTARRSSAAATRSPTASTSPAASSTPASSSSASRRTRHKQFVRDPDPARRQRSASTSTSSTPAAPCSRSPPGSGPRAATSARA